MADQPEHDIVLHGNARNVETHPDLATLNPTYPYR